MVIEPTNDINNASTRPFAKPDPAAKLFWLDQTPPAPAGLSHPYGAYIVKFVKRVVDDLTFIFINPQDATDIDKEYTIDVTKDLVWPDLPSTIPKAGAPESYGFLFLDRKNQLYTGMEASAKAAAISVPIVFSSDGTGKYPKSG
jgi:hypothetical protein